MTPTPTLWAFWKYDRFPGFRSGKVVEQRSDGKVKVEGYSNMVFPIFYLASGEHGENLHKLGQKLSEAYRIHEQCLRNSAGRVAARELTNAGLPIASLNLEQTGWHGEAYETLFRKQLELEK